jgi:uncharacterized protein (TIGR02996 family)
VRLVDPMLAKVLAAPDDDGLRQVWADALVERGDPRGELVAIQVAAAREALTPAQERRARSLLAKHRVEWLGDLAGVVQRREGLVFDRGLVAGCQIHVAKLSALQKAIGHPLWATVRKMWFLDRHAYSPRIVPLLTHPVMVSLREIVGIGMGNVFAALGRSERPLPFTSIWTIDDDWRSKPLLRFAPRFGGEALPDLRVLGFKIHGEARWILELPIVRRIETLGLTSYEPAGEWIPRVEPLGNVTTLELPTGSRSTASGRST